MLIDTHSHVNFNAYKDDADEVLRRSLASDIWVINVGSQSTTSERAVAMAEKYDQGVYAVVGLHPIHLHASHVDESEQGIDFKARGEEFDYDFYKKLAQHEKVVGIGEMGLDYFHLPEDVPEEEVKQLQSDVFRKGLDLAQEVDKPMAVHTRSAKGTINAYGDVYDVLQDHGYTRAVIHCFGGTLEQAQKFIDLGCLISVTGIVTFKNAPDIHELVRQLPLEKMMVETDAPYLSPVPHRGERNEPSYTKYVAEKIAELKGVSFDEVAEMTTATARKFFNL